MNKSLIISYDKNWYGNRKNAFPHLKYIHIHNVPNICGCMYIDIYM